MQRVFFFTRSKRCETDSPWKVSHLNGECADFEQNGHELVAGLVMAWTVFDFCSQFCSSLCDFDEYYLEGGSDWRTYR